VSSPVDRFLFGVEGGVGALWWATVAFILGFVGILGLIKGAWWAGFLLLPACVLAVQASRSFNRGER
jgi:hypothetical protein